MKLIKPSFEIIDTKNKSIYEMIEIAGRTCYKSEDKITADSAEKFVKMLSERGHGAMLEHGTVYLTYHWDGAVCETCGENLTHNNIFFYYSNKYSKVNRSGNNLYITTNYRVIIENDRIDDLQYLTKENKPTEHHEKRVMVKFICDRGVSHEFVRHRVFSFAQESTRYCNYSKDKFGNELTFIQPCWLDEDYVPDLALSTAKKLDARTYYTDLENAEGGYFHLLSHGWTPQQARSVLPNSLKTELIMTGFISDWEHFFKLRCDKATHPQARELAIPLKIEFKKLL